MFFTTSIHDGVEDVNGRSTGQLDDVREEHSFMASMLPISWSVHVAMRDTTTLVTLLPAFRVARA